MSGERASRSPVYACNSAPILEEPLQKRGRSRFIDTAIDLRSVMAGRLRENARPVLHAPALGVRGTEIKPPETREGDRGRAHGAGLERHVEIAVSEPWRPLPFRRGAQYQHLGMGRGIAALFHA